MIVLEPRKHLMGHPAHALARRKTKPMCRRLGAAMLLALVVGCSNGSFETPSVITAFDPNSGPPAGATSILNIGATQIEVQGAHFSRDDVVSWNGKPQSTTFKGPGEFDATLAPGLTDAEGSAQISVVTAGGVRSNSVTVTVNQIAVVLTNYSPTSADPASGPMTFTLNGAGFVVGAGISFNGLPLVTTRESGNRLTAPLAASLLGQPGNALIRIDVPCCGNSNQPFSKSLSFPIGAFTITKTPLFDSNPSTPVDLAWDATTGRLYAEQNTVASRSILFVDPSTGLVSPGVTTDSSQLDGIVLSGDDQFVYTVDRFSASPATRYTLPGFTSPTQVGVPGTLQVAPAPGLPATAALRLGDGSVVIVDGTTPRPNTIRPPQSPYFPYPPLTVWGLDSSTLYVQSPFQGTNGLDLVQRFTVDANGIAAAPTELTSTFRGNKLVYDRTVRRLFGSNGDNFDEQGSSHGTFALPVDRTGRSLGCEMAPDGAIGKVFFACDDDLGITVRSFDADTSAPLGLVVLFPAPVPDGFGPVNLVRWGTSGLALTIANQIVFYSGAFVH
jgi:hypothetical protein